MHRHKIFYLRLTQQRSSKMQLKGKVAIVTGGAGGLGRVVAAALLQKEAKVCLFDIHEGRGAEVVKSLQDEFGADSVSFHQCDITSDRGFSDAFQSVVSRHGNVDVMINNAAILSEKGDIDKMILTNLGGTIRGSNLAIKHMRRDEGGKGGVVINVSSVTGFRVFFAIPSYVATKHGIVGFTRSWAANPYLKDLGLRFAIVCPSTFTSFIIPYVEEQMLYGKEHLEVNKHMGEQDPKDVAAGFIELLEDDESNGVMLHSSATEGTHRKRIEVVDES